MTQEESMTKALEALESARENLERIAEADADFSSRIEGVSDSIDDVFERQKALEQSIARIDGAIDRLNSSVDRLSELEARISELSAKLERLNPEELDRIVSKLREEASDALGKINEGLKPAAPKKTSGAALKGVATKKK